MLTDLFSREGFWVLSLLTLINRELYSAMVFSVGKRVALCTNSADCQGYFGFNCPKARV